MGDSGNLNDHSSLVIISSFNKSYKINKANLSVEVDNDFMEHVLANSDQLVGRKGISGDLYIVNPAKIFHTICESAWRSAEPGILFVDRLRNYNIMEFVDDYQIETTNPCGRWPQVKNWAISVKTKS